MEFGKRYKVSPKKRKAIANAKKAMKLHHREGITLKQAWKIVKSKMSPKKRKTKTSPKKRKTTMSPKKRKAVSKAKKAMKLHHREGITLKQAWRRVNRFGAPDDEEELEKQRKEHIKLDMRAVGNMGNVDSPVFKNLRGADPDLQGGMEKFFDGWDDTVGDGILDKKFTPTEFAKAFADLLDRSHKAGLVNLAAQPFSIYWRRRTGFLGLGGGLELGWDIQEYGEVYMRNPEDDENFCGVLLHAAIFMGTISCQLGEKYHQEYGSEILKELQNTFNIKNINAVDMCDWLLNAEKLFRKGGGVTTAEWKSIKFDPGRGRMFAQVLEFTLKNLLSKNPETTRNGHTQVWRGSVADPIDLLQKSRCFGNMSGEDIFKRMIKWALDLSNPNTNFGAPEAVGAAKVGYRFVPSLLPPPPDEPLTYGVDGGAMEWDRENARRKKEKTVQERKKDLVEAGLVNLLEGPPPPKTVVFPPEQLTTPRSVGFSPNLVNNRKKFLGQIEELSPPTSPPSSDTRSPTPSPQLTPRPLTDRNEAAQKELNKKIKQIIEDVSPKALENLEKIKNNNGIFNDSEFIKALASIILGFDSYSDMEKEADKIVKSIGVVNHSLITYKKSIEDSPDVEERLKKARAAGGVNDHLLGIKQFTFPFDKEAQRYFGIAIDLPDDTINLTKEAMMKVGPIIDTAFSGGLLADRRKVASTLKSLFPTDNPELGEYEQGMWGRLGMAKVDVVLMDYLRRHKLRFLPLPKNLPKWIKFELAMNFTVLATKDSDIRESHAPLVALYKKMIIASDKSMEEDKNGTLRKMSADTERNRMVTRTGGKLTVARNGANTVMRNNRDLQRVREQMFHRFIPTQPPRSTAALPIDPVGQQLDNILPSFSMQQQGRRVLSRERDPFPYIPRKAGAREPRYLGGVKPTVAKPTVAKPRKMPPKKGQTGYVLRGGQIVSASGAVKSSFGTCALCGI